MKVLKINEELHADLKKHLENSNVFMQSYVEYLVRQAIEKEMVYAMKEMIEGLKPYVFTNELEKSKGKKIYPKYTELKKKNPHLFKLIPDNIKEFNEYMNGILEFQEPDTPLYFNVPGYANVINPKVKPENGVGVMQYVQTSKIDGFPVFRMLVNIPENLEDALNKPDGGKFQIKMKIKVDPIDNPFESFELIKGSVDDSFYDEVGIKFENEKYDIPKTKDVTFEDFKINLLEFVKSHANKPKEIPQLGRIIYSDTDEGFRKIVTRIMAVSNLIATTCRFGPAHNLIIPTQIADLFKGSPYMTFLSCKTNQIDSEETVLKPIGSINGMTVLESKEIDEIYIYRTCENTFRLDYSFDKCDVDEICFSLVNSVEGAIYKIDILKEYDSKPINEYLVNKLSDYEFIDIDGTYSPYSLNVSELAFDYGKGESKEVFEKSGLDYEAASESTLMREILQDTIRKITNVDGFKSKQMKIYGNESFQEIHEMIKNTINECTRNAKTTIVTNGNIGVALRDSAGFTPDEYKSDPGMLYSIGHFYEHPVYVDPYMKYNDNRIFCMNDVQLKHAEDGILISAYKSDSIVVMTTAYKMLKDIIVINVKDNELRLV